MKRLAIAAGVMVLGTGGALAAPCTSILTTPNSETFAPSGTLLADSGTPVAPGCEISNVLDVSAPGRYVNYRVDSRIAKDLPDGSATYTITGPNGDVRTIEITDATVDGSTNTQYFALGLDPGTGLDADFDMVFFGNDFFAEIDSLDVVVGWTTLADQEAALDGVGRQQLGLVTHLGAMNDLLTGGNLRLEGDDEIGIFGAIGSHQVGVRARYNLAEGFSILGGASILDINTGGASASGVSGAAALRYVEPGVLAFRLFGEGGVQFSALNLGFTRNYADGTVEGFDATGTGDALLGGGYVRAGVVWLPDSSNEVLFSAGLSHSALGIGNYVEADDQTFPNFFAADLSGATSYTTVKAGVDWTTQLTPEVDVTASGHIGAAFGSGANADVFGVGPVTGAAQSTVFAQYGLRLGWTLSEGSTLDGFVQGTTGTGIGTHAQVGAAYRMSF